MFTKCMSISFFQFLLVKVCSLLIIQSVQAEPTKAERVILLNPSLIQLFKEFNLEKMIVGQVTVGSEQKVLPLVQSVGSYLSPNPEMIHKLQPTLVMTYKEGMRSLRGFEKSEKFQFQVFEMSQLEHYKQLIQWIGDRFLVQKKAQVLKSKWDKSIRQIQSSRKGSKPKSLLILLDARSLIAAGQDTFLVEAFQLCGLTPVLKQNGYPSLQSEAIFKLSPNIILNLSHGELPQGLNKSVKRDEMQSQVKQANSVALTKIGFPFLAEVLKICQELNS